MRHGAVFQMTLLSERENARTDLVVTCDSQRLLICEVTIRSAVQCSAVQCSAVLFAEAQARLGLRCCWGLHLAESPKWP
jgi:hypothetical protein